MNRARLEKAMAKYELGRPFRDLEKLNRIFRDFDEGAASEHVGTGRSDHMSDWVECSCGWKSDGFWDLIEAAWEQWRNHVMRQRPRVRPERNLNMTNPTETLPEIVTPPTPETAAAPAPSAPPPPTPASAPTAAELPPPTPKPKPAPKPKAAAPKAKPKPKPAAKKGRGGRIAGTKNRSTVLKEEIARLENQLRTAPISPGRLDLEKKKAALTTELETLLRERAARSKAKPK